MQMRGLLRAVRTLLVVVGAATVLVTTTPVVPWIARALTIGWTDGGGDVLVVLMGSTVTGPTLPGGRLAGQNTYWRAVHAVHIWRTNHFRRLVLIGEHSEDVKPLFVSSGIPESQIDLETRSTTTRENAAFARPLLSGETGRILMVSSDFHMYRAVRCFRQEGINVLPQPAPDILKRARSPFARWQCLGEVATEIVKIGYYRFRGWI